jgi:hypothetical protein
MPTQTRKFLNLSQLARRLDMPYTRLLNLVHQGKLIPDATAGVAHLFNEQSVPRVEKALAQLLRARFSHPQVQGRLTGRVL